MLAAFDYSLNNQYFTGELLKGSLPAALAIILLIVAYVLGQINDTPARAVLNNELSSSTCSGSRAAHSLVRALVGNA